MLYIHADADADDSDVGDGDGAGCCNAAAGSRIRSSRSLLGKPALLLPAAKLLVWERNPKKPATLLPRNFYFGKEIQLRIGVQLVFDDLQLLLNMYHKYQKQIFNTWN